MSERAEEGMPEEQVAYRDKARRLAIEAAQAFTDQYDSWEGSVVTGFVLVFEVTRPGQRPLFLWCSGDGVMPDDSERGGLSSHRARGLAAEFLAELDGREVEFQKRRMRGDGE